MPKQPLTFPTVTRQIADQLQQMIRGGRWLADGKVPPMRKLAGEFNVSAATVQSALQILQDKGIVEMRDRSGVFINRPRYQSAKSTYVGLLTPYLEVDMSEQDRELLRRQMSFSFDADEWSSHINRSFLRTLKSHHLDLMAIPVPLDQGDFAAAATQRIERLGTPLAGAMFTAFDFTRPLVKELDKRDIPWVTINPLTQHSVYNFVAADNLHGGKRVGRCLAAMGLREVLVLCRSMGSFRTDVEKTLGLYQGYMEKDVPVDRIVTRTVKDPLEATGYAQTKAYLAETGGKAPQAIFAISDSLAIGAIRALHEAKFRVPQDVGVIGATGLNLASTSDPALTTLTQPMNEIGHQAGEMLTFMIREGVRRLVGRRVPGPLIFRDSIRIPEEQRREADLEFQQTVEQLRAVAVDAVEATIHLKDTQLTGDPGGDSDNSVESTTER
ncbi:MAG: substrate-binding domain-containing protein [Phycisphaerales bacterium]|nr:substrate-binding domain-containing protein [Phycisphaerales bacterium]